MSFAEQGATASVCGTIRIWPEKQRLLLAIEMVGDFEAVMGL